MKSTGLGREGKAVQGRQGWTVKAVLDSNNKTEW